jgi:hypothetical protein
MEVTLKEIAMTFILFLLVLGTAIALGQVRITGMGKTISQLQNESALKDKTIEEQKGLYEKLTLQEQNVQSVLDSKDPQIKELEAQLKATKQQALTATQVALTWKKAYEGAAKATQSTVSSPSAVTTGPSSSGTTSLSRERVDFNQTYDFLGVTGYTMTNPPEAYLKIQQLRPLKLTLAVTQDSTKAWHTYVTSSEENVQPEVTVTAVNPFMEDPKWYERISLKSDVGLGSTSGGAGVLLGLGATLDVGKFTVGPAAWVTVSDRVDKYLGVMAGWRPFAH